MTKSGQAGRNRSRSARLNDSIFPGDTQAASAMLMDLSGRRNVVAESTAPPLLRRSPEVTGVCSPKLATRPAFAGMITPQISASCVQVGRSEAWQLYSVKRWYFLASAEATPSITPGPHRQLRRYFSVAKTGLEACPGHHKHLSVSRTFNSMLPVPAAELLKLGIGHVVDEESVVLSNHLGHDVILL